MYSKLKFSCSCECSHNSKAKNARVDYLDRYNTPPNNGQSNNAKDFTESLLNEVLKVQKCKTEYAEIEDTPSPTKIQKQEDNFDYVSLLNHDDFQPN